MLHVKQIINDIFTSNTYIIFDDRFTYCWIVDIGDYKKVADVLPQGIDIKGLLLTHTHFDHVYGINALHKAYPNCRVYTSSYGCEALYDDKKNFSRYHESSFIFEGDDITILADGDTLDIYPNISLKVYYTPGHCPSCLTYDVSGYLFTGDAYIPGVKVVTKLPQGDRLLAKQSTEKILSLAEGKIICPGHGKMM